MTMRERMEAGMLFTDECEGLDKEREQCKHWMELFNASHRERLEERFALQTKLFGKAAMAWIEPPFFCCYGTHITMGEGCYINCNCTFVDDGRITLGNRVMVGPGSVIATVGHPLPADMRKYMYTRPVVIEDDVWLGANVTVCPGVTVGSGSVIGAGSVVTRDIPANVLAAGNPCRVLRPITEADRPKAEELP